MTRSKSSTSLTSRTSGSPGRRSVWVNVCVPVVGSTVEALLKRIERNALPSTGTWRPLVPTNWVATASDQGGRPYVPTDDGPNSKTTRSNPGLCAARTPVIWAWNAVLPPLWAGQATGVAPAEGLGPTVALGLGDGVGGGVVGEGRATVGVGVGAAVVGAADVTGGVTVTGVQAATAIRAAAQNRRRRSDIVAPV
jgi:hypothetical protein